MVAAGASVGLGECPGDSVGEGMGDCFGEAPVGLGEGPGDGVGEGFGEGVVVVIEADSAAVVGGDESIISGVAIAIVLSSPLPS